MLLNEHQSKRLFGEVGIVVPHGDLLRPADVAGYVPGGRGPWFCKAQVQIGGRGKAGGVLRADKPEDIPSLCEQLFRMKIKGHDVPLVRVELNSAYSREFYLSFSVSRKRESLVLTAGAGGMDVEDASVTGKRPLVQNISAVQGLLDYQIRAAFFHLFAPDVPEKECWPGFRDLVRRLYKAVREYGLLVAEINPLVLSADKQWTALDGKVQLDENMRDLRPDLERFYQPEHASREENAAREAGLSFVPFSGWVGILVNGAGLAMTTMDLLNFSGVPAANFMDLGGAADEQRMRTALELLFGNEQVKVIFLNLFGGIVSCAAVAKALSAALDGKPPSKPLVVRMDGNESAAGREIVASLGQEAIHVAADMHEAIQTLHALKPRNKDGVDYPVFHRPPPVLLEARGTCALGERRKNMFLDLTAGSKVLVQGITGRTARLHTELMLHYGSNIVAGVTPFKQGERVLGVPVYNTVHSAMQEHPDIAASIVFVPAAFAAEAVLEAADQGVPWIICITEGIPQQHMLAVREALKQKTSRLVGPNTPGIIVPGQVKIGIMPGDVFVPGPVAVFSRSGTLTYETSSRLSAAGLGQSVCVGVGGDPFIGVDFCDMAEMVRDHQDTRAVIVLGEIGGTAEEDLAAYVRSTGYDKPVFSFIAGRTAPEGKRLGHAGAILEEGGGGIEAKIAALAAAGIQVCPDVASIPEMVANSLKTL